MRLLSIVPNCTSFRLTNSGLENRYLSAFHALSPHNSTLGGVCVPYRLTRGPSKTCYNPYCKYNTPKCKVFRAALQQMESRYENGDGRFDPHFNAKPENMSISNMPTRRNLGELRSVCTKAKVSKWQAKEDYGDLSGGLKGRGRGRHDRIYALGRLL
eukprot:Gb_02885 [translate_table: standard]